MNGKKIFFSKMHGIGNDFIVIENISQKFTFSKKIVQFLSNRHLGIGCDQLLIVEKSDNIKYDFYYRIFNSNGSEVEQCGNGARCFAYFVYLKKIIRKKKIIVKTNTSILHIHFINKNNITVNMGKPKIKFVTFPLLCVKPYLYNIYFKNSLITFGLISIGNPHCIILVPDIKSCLVEQIGQFLNSQNHLFPFGINVNFMQIINKNEFMLRVYERGVGETKSCGSGACASTVFGILQKLLECNVSVVLPGGTLQIFWNKQKNVVYMNGPAEHVYDGYIYI